LCASLDGPASGSSSCTAAAGATAPQVLSDNGGTPRLVFGVSPAGAARVVLDNGSEQVEADTTTFGDGRLYGGSLDPLPTQVIFYAADGSELARQPVNQ
jgi:hypothetical protein